MTQFKPGANEAFRPSRKPPTTDSDFRRWKRGCDTADDVRMKNLPVCGANSEGRWCAIGLLDVLAEGYSVTTASGNDQQEGAHVDAAR